MKEPRVRKLGVNREAKWDGEVMTLRLTKFLSVVLTKAETRKLYVFMKSFYRD